MNRVNQSGSNFLFLELLAYFVHERDFKVNFGVKSVDWACVVISLVGYQNQALSIFFTNDVAHLYSALVRAWDLGESKLLAVIASEEGEFALGVLDIWIRRLFFTLLLLFRFCLGWRWSGRGIQNLRLCQSRFDVEQVGCGAIWAASEINTIRAEAINVSLGWSTW